MADVAVEQNETPVVEKEVVEVDAPKVVDEENEVAKNGNGEEAKESPVESAENGTTEEPATEEPTTEEVTSAEEPVDVQNGDSTEAAPEAVKRKAVEETDAAEVADESAPTPEKKSKVEEAAHENGAAEEVVA